MNDDVDVAGVDELGVGDTFELPHGPEIVIVGMATADEAPESEPEQRLYEAEIRTETDTDAEVDTLLYGPHDFAHALAGGAEYVGRRVEASAEQPFWCDGCLWPHRGKDRRTIASVRDVDVCSYGCEQDVYRGRLQERLEADGGRR